MLGSSELFSTEYVNYLISSTPLGWLGHMELCIGRSWESTFSHTHSHTHSCIQKHMHTMAFVILHSISSYFLLHDRVGFAFPRILSTQLDYTDESEMSKYLTNIFECVRFTLKSKV